LTISPLKINLINSINHIYHPPTIVSFQQPETSDQTPQNKRPESSGQLKSELGTGRIVPLTLGLAP